MLKCLLQMYNKEKIKIIFINERNEIVMKTIEKISLVLFSSLILIISVILCLTIFGWVDLEVLGNIIRVAVTDDITSKILLGLSIIFILLAIRCIFFDSNSKEKEDYKNGILLENANGKLLITKETIENLVNGVVKGFDSAEDVTTKIELDSENNVKVFVNLTVKENAVIKELSTNLQNKIKETVKKSSDLEVKEVNIKVQNIEQTKENIIEA